MDLKNIDRSGWETYRFDKIAQNIRETVEPSETELEVYVGLEHLDPESIRIKRHGVPSDVKGTKLRAYPSDVIFGRRRAYQRKASVIETECICSAHSMILRANPEVILPELLPFFLHSDTFMYRAVDISVGSLSPTINWGTLKKQEFLLPPKPQQARLAELLWAAQEVVEGRQRLLRELNTFYKTKRINLFFGGNGEDSKKQKKLKVNVPKKLQFQKLESILKDIRYGSSKKSNTNKEGLPILRIPNVVNEKISTSDVAYVQLSKKEFESSKLLPKDIVVVRTNGNPEYVGRSAIFNLSKPWVFASYLIKITIDQSGYLPEYLIRYMQSTPSRSYFFRHATSTAGNYNINTQIIKSLPVPVVPIQDQRSIVDQLIEIEESIHMASIQEKSDKQIQKSLINQIF